MVTIGTKIQLPGRAQPYAVTRLLGAGGEGDVYEMRSADGDSKAIKWYHEQVSIPERRAHISSLVDRGAPSAGYLWPLALVEDSSTGRFGYVMDLRPEGYVDLASLLKNEVGRNEIKHIATT